MSDEETKTVEQKVEQPAEQEVEKVESPKKITVPPKKKEKDPKKVAQGKRLAQISERAKREKIRREIEEENKLFDFSVNYSTLVSVGVPAVVFLGFYFYSKSRVANRDPPTTTTKNASPQKPEPEKKSAKHVSLFD